MRSIQEPVGVTPRSSTEPESELRELRETCWRQEQEIHSLRETVEVLRAGANRLAAVVTERG